MFQYFKCYLTSLFIGLHVVFIGRLCYKRGTVHRFSNHIRHLQEAALAFAESQVHHLIRR